MLGTVCVFGSAVLHRDVGRKRLTVEWCQPHQIQSIQSKSSRSMMQQNNSHTPYHTTKQYKWNWVCIVHETDYKPMSHGWATAWMPLHYATALRMMR